MLAHCDPKEISDPVKPSIEEGSSDGGEEESQLANFDARPQGCVVCAFAESRVRRPKIKLVRRLRRVEVTWGLLMNRRVELFKLLRCGVLTMMRLLR